MTDSTPVRRWTPVRNGTAFMGMRSVGYDAVWDDANAYVREDDFDRLQAENVRLAAQATDWSKHPEAQATIGGRARLSIELSIVNDLLAGETDISPMMVEYWHETHDKLQALIAERDSLRAHLAAALAKVEEAQRDAERWRWYRNHRVTHGSALEEDIDSAMTAKEGG